MGGGGAPRLGASGRSPGPCLASPRPRRDVSAAAESTRGGVRAVVRCERVGLADNWLRHVQDVQEKHQGCLCQLGDDARSARLCELNVIEQVANVWQTSIVRDAWARKQDLTVHGWIYGLRDGKLHDLNCSANNLKDAAANYTAAVKALSK